MTAKRRRQGTTQLAYYVIQNMVSDPCSRTVKPSGFLSNKPVSVSVSAPSADALLATL